MAVKRFELNLSQLDDAAYGLDGPSGRSFILDSSQLDGADVLDGSPFLTTATASSSLGGLSASVIATVTEFAVLSAPLGGLGASASATVTEFAVLSAPLGALNASASATVTEFAVLSAPLGGLSASAIAQAEGFPVFTATLGGISASATAVVTPINPEPVVGGSKYRYAKHRKKLEEQQKIAEKQQYETPVVIVQPKPKMQITHLAFAHSTLGGSNIQATGSITFSILDDDAEILLMV
jgi:hypothetical protein